MSDCKHRMSLAVVLSVFGVSLTNITLPAHATNADVTAAQQALDKVVMYKQGDKASTAKIMCAIDFEPLQAFTDMGLTIIETDEVRYAHIGLSETYNSLIT